MNLKTLIIIILICSSQHLIAQEMAPKVNWKFKTNGPIRSAPVIDQHQLYFVNSAGSVYCINKSQGNLIWEYDTQAAINASPAVTNELVIVVNRSEEVYALDRFTGKIKWQQQLGPTIVANVGGWKYFTAGPVVSDNLVFVPSGDGALYAFDSNNGKLHWKYQINKRIRATPLVHDDLIFQPANDGRLHVLDKNTGKKLWQFETDGANPSPDNPFKEIIRGNYDQPSLQANTLVFGSRDGHTYAVDIENHQEIWRLTYGSTWAMANSIHENTVYMGWSTNNLVCAIDLQSGQEKWKYQAGGHNYTKPLIVDNAVYFGSADGNFYKLNEETGALEWKYDIDSEIYSSPVCDNEIFYFGSDDGFLYALQEAAMAKLVVYQPDSISGLAQFVVSDGKLLPFLLERGFDQLSNEEALQKFIIDRIDDRTPSVIVFSLPIIPQSIMGKDVKKGLFRQYLETGGKVVWLGTVPNFFALNENGQFKRDTVTGAAMLDITYINPTEGGNYFCLPTRTGLNMGLPAWTKSTGAVVKPNEDIVPLTIDEFGNITGWLKKFHPRNGAGFISNRSWGWNVEAHQSDLEIIYQLAINGLK